MAHSRRAWLGLGQVGAAFVALLTAGAAAREPDSALTAPIGAPLLFAKRFNYVGLHIYDTYYKWRPG
ncbi:MAG: hypothetical protein JXR77_02225, partial [Lentisphaeria bacterium]|nr:hypothetical protein [Lentisphaeria bacterium]